MEPRHHNKRSVGRQQSSHHFSFVTSYTHIISQLLPSQSQDNPYKRPKVCHKSFLDDDGSSEGEVTGTHLTSANSKQYPRFHCKSVYSYHSETNTYYFWCNSAKLLQLAWLLFSVHTLISITATSTIFDYIVSP